MGRHSAPDDDSEEPFDGAVVALAQPAVSRGRHARPDEDESDQTAFDDTGKIARIDLAEEPADEPIWSPVDSFDEPVLDEPAAAQARRHRHERSTAADFALVRAHGDVRARVIAAVLAPFVVYTAAMAVVGKLDRSYLLWIWIPLITAGVVGGLVLDLGHRKYSR